MSIKVFVIKLWQRIPSVTPFLWDTIKGLRHLSNPASKNKYFNFAKPVLFFLSCNSLMESNGPINSVTKYDVEENISHLMTLARIALEKGDAERATAILEMGIRICEEYESYVALPYMYDILASISFALGNMGKAEHLLVSAIEKLLQIGFSENDTQVVDFQLRLARIYSAYDQMELAEVGFKDCLNKQKKKIIDGDTSTKTGMLYVNVLFWYGLHKIQNKEHTTAKQLITSAYDYSLKIKGLSPYQEMVILYTLADLHMQLGENNMALQNMQSAIMLGRGIGSTDMPKCYLKLAQIYVNLGAWNNAKESCQESLKLAALFNDVVIKNEAEDTLESINERIC